MMLYTIILSAVDYVGKNLLTGCWKGFFKYLSIPSVTIKVDCCILLSLHSRKSIIFQTAWTVTSG